METAGHRADSMREILARALDPEIHAWIREAVRDSYETGDPDWRKLIRGADVVLDGQSMNVLDGSSVPYEKNLSDLRQEALQLITSAGRVGVIVDFAQAIATRPTLMCSARQSPISTATQAYHKATMACY